MKLDEIPMTPNFPSRQLSTKSYCFAFAWLILSIANAVAADSTWTTGEFRWKSSAPLIDVEAQRAAEDPHVALKDPSVVFHDGRWHLFATLRMKSGRVCMQYLSFTDWAQANTAPREILSFTDKYHGAPQVFYFSPHKRWYLIFQLADETRTPQFGPCFSTTTTLGDVTSWTKPQPMVTEGPARPKWLDFWAICDAEKAHLFYTSLDGQMWRRATKLADFLIGWSEQALALKADIFEASHTYKLKGREQYLTIIEAQATGRRYYKAYVADRLEGPWNGLADTLAKPFAARGKRAAIDRVDRKHQPRRTSAHGHRRTDGSGPGATAFPLPRRERAELSQQHEIRRHPVAARAAGDDGLRGETSGLRLTPRPAGGSAPRRVQRHRVVHRPAGSVRSRRSSRSSADRDRAAFPTRLCHWFSVGTAENLT